MTALAANTTKDRWVARIYPGTLTSGQTAYQGGLAALVIGTGKLVTATGAANQLVIGTFQKGAVVTADTAIGVDLGREIQTVAHVNGAGGAAIAATDVGKICYVNDDQTVGILPTGCVAGRIWKVDSVAGVFVEPMPDVGMELRAAPAATLAYASNDCVLTAAQAVNGAVYDVPTTVAAATITLPVTGIPDGTTLTFIADGTKNGHTVTYRFGTTAISAALTASKIHCARVTKLGSGWGITATVSP